MQGQISGLSKILRSSLMGVGVKYKGFQSPGECGWAWGAQGWQPLGEDWVGLAKRSNWRASAQAKGEAGKAWLGPKVDEMLRTAGRGQGDSSRHERVLGEAVAEGGLVCRMDI